MQYSGTLDYLSQLDVCIDDNADISESGAIFIWRLDNNKDICCSLF